MSVTHLFKRPVAFLVILLVALAVACGASATSTPVSTESSAAPVATTEAAAPVPTAVTAPTEPPAMTGGEAKVDRLIMGLISPTRDYFRTWILGSADQLIKQDPMMEWLFEISPVTNTMEPWLATEATLAEDSMSWNLKLAKGAVWHDKNGTDFGEFNAADVVHSHAIWCDPDYPGREDDPALATRSVCARSRKSKSSATTKSICCATCPAPT